MQSIRVIYGPPLSVRSVCFKVIETTGESAANEPFFREMHGHLFIRANFMSVCLFSVPCY